MGSSIERFLREQAGAPAPTTTGDIDLRAPVAPVGVPKVATPAPSFADVSGVSTTTAPTLDASARLGAAVQPARAARVLALEIETGLPTDLIDRNLDAVEREARRFDFDPDRLRRESPAVAAWMAEAPTRAAAARPDVERLSWIERQIRHVRTSFAEGRATVERSELGAKALAGTITSRDRDRLRALDAESEARQTELTALDLGGLEDIPGVVAGQLPIFARSLAGGVGNAQIGLLQGAGIGAVGGGLLGSAAGGVGAIPGAATGAVAGAAIGTKTGFAVGSAVEAARMEAGLAYLEFEGLRDERGLPLDPDAARGAARIVGVINGALELAGIESLVAAAPGLRSLSRTGLRRALQTPTVRAAFLRYARAVGTGTATEGVTEGTQSLVTHAAGELARLAQDGTLQGMSPDAVLDAVFTDAALQAAGQEAILGAKAGGGIATAAGGASAALDVRRARQATQTSRAFQRIGEGVAATELQKTAPAALRQVMERIAADGPVRDVYLPIDTFDAYWQSKGVDPAQVAEEVLGQAGRAAYAEARASGSDLVVPMARYATTIAPVKEHNDFFVRELRAAPEAMNAREADAFLASEPVAEADAAATDPAAESAARVRARMVEQLTGAGYEPQAADTYAAVYEAAFRTLGERASIDPEALFDRFGVSVQRAESPEAIDAPAVPRTVPDVGAMAERVALSAAERAEAIAGAYAVEPRRRDADLADETGAFAYARTGAGRLRANLESVRDDGLVDELLRLYDANSADGIQTAGVSLENDDGSRWTGQKGGGMAASGRVAARSKSIARIEAELTRRGIDPAERMGALAEAQQGAAMDAEAGLDTSFDFGDEADPASDEFFQQRAPADAPRGRIRFRRQDGNVTGAAIDVFAGADLSTILHESAHLYLEVVGELATGPDPAASISRDYATLLTWLGVENRNQIGRDQHEQFARGFEAYLYEGKAPTAELRGAFARFRAWLVAIYRNVKALDVTLTPDVREVFDRLLATDDELAAARQAIGAVPLFPDPAAVGLTEEQAARYTRAVDAANRAATERLTRETMREYQRERAAWWKTARAAMRERVAAEANADRGLRARSLLSRHVMPDGSEPPEGMPALKLSRAALVERFGPDILANLPRPYVYAREGGLGPDEAASLFGFDSGEALVQALAESERPRDWIDRVTDERMKAEHGDLMTDGRLPEAALDAIHTDRRARLLRLELEYLATADLPALAGMVRKVARRVPPLAELQAQAEATIAAKRVRDVTPIVYQRAEQRAAREAVALLTKGDVAGAFDAKLRQVQAHALWRAATDARQKVDGAVRFLGRYETPKARARLGKAGRQYLHQVDALLARFDLGRGVSQRALDRRQSLREFVAAEQAAGRPITVPEALLAEARTTHWQEATVEEVLGLRDAVAQIAHLARLKNRLLASDRARTLDEARAEIVGAIGATHDLTVPPKEINPTLGVRLAQGTRRAMAEHTRMEFFFRHLDGGQATGTVWSYLFKPFADAEARESAMRERDAEALRTLFGAYTPEERRRMYRDRLNLPMLASGTVTGTLTKANLLAIALNQGNSYNRDALLAGYGWTQAQVDAVLDAGLDARDWAFVQGVWDYLETYWPAIAEQQQALTGLEPGKVEATPVTTRHGTFRGGYYPIKFDGDLSHKQAALDEKASVEEMMGGNWARAMTRHGHTIARTDTGGKPLRLELGVIGEHLAQVTHDLAFRLPVLDVHRLLQDEEIAAAIEAAGGSAMRRQLNPWLVGIAGDRGATTTTGIERALGHLRAGATVVGLGLRVTSSLLQLTGFLTTVNELGAADTLRGIRATVGRSPRDLARQYRFVAERSRMMVDRRQNFDRDVRDYLRKQDRVGPDSAAFFALIGWMDMLVAVPTWLGAYGRALEGRADGIATGDEPAAIAYADMVVRTTQGAGSAKDLAAVQRGGEAWRLFTMYYSSMSVFFNQFQQAGGDFARTRDVPRLLAQLTLLWFLPAVLDDLMKGDGPEDDESAAGWTARQLLLFPPSTVIGLRDVASAVEWGMRTGTTGFDGSPVFAAGEELTRALLALHKAADPEQDVTRRDVKAAVLTVGYFAKLPTSQAWTTAEYLHDVLTGTTTPTGPLDFLWRATTRGTPRDDR